MGNVLSARLPPRTPEEASEALAKHFMAVTLQHWVLDAPQVAYCEDSVEWAKATGWKEERPAYLDVKFQ